ncbi:MAG: adenylate kinase [Acidobacteriaceae bacterium]|nr:adenylate kinase [Acidobacteriaceae bacterium]MBV9296347.1 adenylate kinase [Acidobacteriaceae bacterium]MBV9766852.1 adenylate kinase [Acidobacteriaceae bacterium]
MFAGAKVIILLGPPGSGKGTQAERLSSALGICAISTGEMLRREAQSGSALGKMVQDVLSSGQLVSDNLINRVVAHRLQQADCATGCILDGYPRTVAQAQFLDALLEKWNVPAPVVLNFEIPCEEVVSRLSRRRQCTECGRVYTVSTLSTETGILCDRDGSMLVQRADDHPSTIRERLRIYEKNAGQLINYYRSRDYHRVCATGAPSEIADGLMALLGSQWLPSLSPVVLAEPRA